MVSKQLLLRLLPPFKGEQTLISDEQQVRDIVKEMEESHRLFAPDYDRIAGYFDAGDVVETARRLFNFCKREIPYKKESDNRQTICSPSGILARGHGDCKHYASWIAGVLDALRRKGERVNWCYRFASYDLFNKVPHHVFAVVQLPGGREVWVDPVLPTFDNRKEYYSKQDKKIPMALYRVSGIDDVAGVGEMGNIFSSAWKGIKKGASAAWKQVKKFAISPARGAFLGLIALNVHGLASALLHNRNQGKLKKTWEGLGGNYNTLKHTFTSGAKKKRIFGIGDDTPMHVQVDGVGIIQVAAALTLAAPIIAALKGFLKGSSSQTDQAVDSTVSALNQSVQQTGTPMLVPEKPAGVDFLTKASSVLRTAEDVAQSLPLGEKARATADDIFNRADSIVHKVHKSPVVNKNARYQPLPDPNKPDYLKWALVAGGGFIALKALKVIK